MPTYEATPRFTADYRRLAPEQRRSSRQAVTAFIDALRTGRFRAGLRVKGIRGAPGVFELTWDGNGRATSQYGPEIVRGAQHIIWRRIGTHAILTGA